MLNELQIDNVAVIEHAEVNFEGGFNVLTGETGAGKSILIDSINAILGNRTSKEIVRTGAQRSSIFAAFDDVPQKVMNVISELGYECDGTLILSRDITADGKSMCRVNGKPATAATVRDIAGTLVNIHGQLDNQELLDPSKHIDIIDRFAGIDLTGYRDLFAKLNETVNEIQKLSKSERDKEARMDLLKFQLNEIESSNLKPGEEEELVSQKNVIQNAEKIIKTLSVAVEAVNGSDDGSNVGAYSLIYDAAQSLNRLSSVSEGCLNAAQKLENIYYLLDEAGSFLSSELDRVSVGDIDLNTVEERLDLIYKLKRKYGNSIEEILEYADDAKKELSSLEYSDEKLEELNKQFKILKDETLKMAGELSAQRKAAFLVFENKIKEGLEFLNMPSVAFSVNCTKLTELTDKGYDNIEFFISANKGETPRALSRIASGGEMARIMLAIKSVMADKDEVPTLIFDEIDTGVSGKSAARIGEKLKQTSSHHQIICVTHSAQVAAYAANHLKIEKEVREDGRTYTSVRRLEYEQRAEELARIISGENITDIALDNAREILAIASEA